MELLVRARGGRGKATWSVKRKEGEGGCEEWICPRLAFRKSSLRRGSVPIKSIPLHLFTSTQDGCNDSVLRVARQADH